MPKIKKAKLVLVDWIDAHTQDGWQSIKEFVESENVLVRTVGWAVRNDDNGVWLAHGYTTDKEGNSEGLNCTFIPRGMIIEMQELKYK